jgi:seryl-tRNA synthetase
MKTDTPKTDAEAKQAWLSATNRVQQVPADFARELERELQEAQAKLQWFMENQNQIAMELMRPAQEEIEAYDAMMASRDSWRDEACGLQHENTRLITELRRYMKAIDDIYNHNKAARLAVIQHFGLNHEKFILANVEVTESSPKKG